MSDRAFEIVTWILLVLAGILVVTVARADYDCKYVTVCDDYDCKTVSICQDW